MKKIFLFVIAVLIIFSAAPALASDEQAQLPTKLTYAKEWFVLNLFSWKYESKLKVLDRYASERVENIQAASQNGADGNIQNLADRYLQINDREKNTIQQKNISTETINMVMQRELERQKILSIIRQETKSESVKNKIVEVQELAVNNVKSVVEKSKNEEEVKKFQNNIVASWRDPKEEIDIKEEKETRVYAAGTNESGTIDEGVIIDGGEAKIVVEKGKLNIEYAPGTGPSSLTNNNGKKLWKIQMSDGLVVESYSAGGNVVVGQSSGTASNIVVNTVAGGTSGTANVVVGNGGNSANTVIVGGKSVKTEQASMESGGPAADPSQTPTNSLNSVNSTNSLNKTSGSGQGVEQAAPATPTTQQ
ncbi:MAG: hypothetical protein M1324_00285 [Patescibacteria group bacterium]|nr:hypothetical protein [Patescibacteria group bacterium]